MTKLQSHSLLLTVCPVSFAAPPVTVVSQLHLSLSDRVSGVLDGNPPRSTLTQTELTLPALPESLAGHLWKGNSWLFFPAP